MSTHLNLIELPNISDFKCVEGVLKNIIELNKDCSLDTKIKQIGLIILAEVAAVFDLTIEMIIFAKECSKDFLNFSFYQTKRLKQLGINTVKLGYFFVGLIPFMIQSQMDFKKLSMCLPEKKIALPTPQFITTKIDSEQEIRKHIKNFDFYYTEASIPDIKFIEEILFWTNKKSCSYLLKQELISEDQIKLDSLNKLYRNGYTLYQLHKKIYPLSVLHFIQDELNGELNNIAKIMNFDSLDMNLHEKIFHSFQKLFSLYEKQIYLINKEQKKNDELELLNFFDKIFPHLTGLLELYLKINHSEIIATDIKHIKNIHKHLKAPDNSILKIQSFLEFLQKINTDSSPYLKKAISCLEKSFEKSLDSLIPSGTIV